MALQREDRNLDAAAGLIAVDHEVQGRLFDALVEAVLKKRRVGLCRGLLRDIEEHARSHFQTEAALMRDHGYPRTAEHVRQHEALLARLSEARAGSLDGPVTLTADEVQAIRDAFEAHVRDLDRDLGAFLRDVSPAPAGAGAPGPAPGPER